MLIDTHCHLYLSEFDQDRGEVMKRALEAGIERFYFPAIDKGNSKLLYSVVSQYPEFCFPMIGVHPCSVDVNHELEMSFVENELQLKKFSAIGEIGLDYYWDTSYIELQKECFIRQIHLADQYNLPIVIHTRNAMNDTIELVKNNLPKRRGIFHCFGGSLDEANQIVDMGFCLGIGGVLTYKKSGLAAVISEISINHIVLETDAPYLAPVPYRGKRNESSYLKIIAEDVARIKGISFKEVAERTSANARAVFAL